MQSIFLQWTRIWGLKKVERVNSGAKEGLVRARVPASQYIRTSTCVMRLGHHLLTLMLVSIVRSNILITIIIWTCVSLFLRNLCTWKCNFIKFLHCYYTGCKWHAWNHNFFKCVHQSERWFMKISIGRNFLEWTHSTMTHTGTTFTLQPLL